MAVTGQTVGDHLTTGTQYVGGLTFLGSATTVIPSAYTKKQHVQCVSIANHGSNPAAVRRTICRIAGATATLTSFKASVTQAIASGTVTIDLYKNGSSILTGTLALSSSGGSGGNAGDVITGTFSSTSSVAGDKFEVVVTVSSPSGGGGLDVQLIYQEDPA
jgi:hypothetical protein